MKCIWSKAIRYNTFQLRREKSCGTYFDGGGGVEHVLQAEVAAVMQVLLAEVLDKLEVVEAVRQ